MQIKISSIVIVDNASEIDLSGWLAELIFLPDLKIYYLRQKHNLGIGAAQNIGINKAFQLNVKFILLLDQDSKASLEMVLKLIDAYYFLTHQGVSIAAIGPSFYDENSRMTSRFLRVGFFRFIVSKPNKSIPVAEVDFLISSGSLIPVDILKTIGLMDESFFIDYVDTEWCLRARSVGLKIFGSYNALMSHSLGGACHAIKPY